MTDEGERVAGDEGEGRFEARRRVQGAADAFEGLGIDARRTSAPGPRTLFPRTPNGVDHAVTRRYLPTPER